MKVHWTDTAEGHLDTIYAYIAKDSSEYALRVVDRLTGRSQQIADFRKIAIETSLFYKLAICLPYFVIGQFLLLTVSVNIRLVSKIVRCLVWQATCQFPQKSIAIFGFIKFATRGRYAFLLRLVLKLFVI